jgi:hypothetical protein
MNSTRATTSMVSPNKTTAMMKPNLMHQVTSCRRANPPSTWWRRRRKKKEGGGFTLGTCGFTWYNKQYPCLVVMVCLNCFAPGGEANPQCESVVPLCVEVWFSFCGRLHLAEVEVRNLVRQHV